MASLLNQAVNIYNYTMEMRDPRTDKWFMTDGPWPTFSIIAFYLYFCTAMGPRMMKNRKALELRLVMAVYNFGMVLFTSYVVVNMLKLAWRMRYNIWYEANNYTENPITLEIINLVYLGYIMKIIELVDTVFIVLRKKDNQISFLHLFHHGSMSFNLWVILRFSPGGHHFILSCFMNCVIHVIMYSYYGLAAMGPKFQKYLWFKRYLTQLQIAQFVIGIIHCSLLMTVEHNYPRGVLAYLISHGVILLILFARFYMIQYKRTNTNQDIKVNAESSKKLN